MHTCLYYMYAFSFGRQLRATPLDVWFESLCHPTSGGNRRRFCLGCRSMAKASHGVKNSFCRPQEGQPRGNGSVFLVLSCRPAPHLGSRALHACVKLPSLDSGQPCLQRRSCKKAALEAERTKLAAPRLSPEHAVLH